MYSVERITLRMFSCSAMVKKGRPGIIVFIVLLDQKIGISLFRL
jgi:hypothetical protein